mmetsp:Transcript_7728/g.18653  ORF Transcript_7728/g.18653 Transcript_7728/m.18653 type:complete len:98 (-) Transcript_7728:1155-1448(-)
MNQKSHVHQPEASLEMKTVREMQIFLHKKRQFLFSKTCYDKSKRYKRERAFGPKLFSNAFKYSYVISDLVAGFKGLAHEVVIRRCIDNSLFWQNFCV